MTKPTGRYMFFEPCGWCRGTGRTPRQTGGWWVDYHYQDGHEQCGPYSEEEAVRRYAEHRDPTSHATLVGPDGQIYNVE